MKNLYLKYKMEEAFNRAKEDVKNKNLDTKGLLSVYGLYKQATVGDINISCPSIFDPKGRAKWNAWESCKGMTRVEAMSAYVEFVNKL